MIYYAMVAGIRAVLARCWSGAGPITIRAVPAWARDLLLAKYLYLYLLFSASYSRIHFNSRCSENGNYDFMIAIRK